MVASACSAGSNGSGGAPSGVGGSSSGGASTSGGAPADGGTTSVGGVSAIGGSGGGTGGIESLTSGGASTGGVGGEMATGGADANGGTPSAGGSMQTGGVMSTAGSEQGGAAQNTGGTAASGGQPAGGHGGDGSGGAAGMGGSEAGSGGQSGPGSYALPPPSQCHNRDYISYEQGCVEGDPSSTCGGKCNVINACMESRADKPYADTAFICPRFMLYGPEMMQAALDDGNADFNYAIVGHDTDRGGVDGQDESTCCQCYQLVFAHPSSLDRQALANPDDVNNHESAIPLPPPLIVQSFNTAATNVSFDVYMAAGGLGANNGCAPVAGTTSRSGEYMYTAYPEIGQPGNGGVKPATHAQECKTELNWVDTESLSSQACQDWVATQCAQIESNIPGLTEQARNSCITANRPQSYYHLNWSVYVMKVECPAHLTEVTGCRLAPQGLPEVDRNALSAADAALNPQFWDTSTAGEMYHTTTMEDCCRPSCAAANWIEDRGLVPDGEYNVFYSCDVNGVPYTE